MYSYVSKPLDFRTRVRIGEIEIRCQLKKEQSYLSRLRGESQGLLGIGGPEANCTVLLVPNLPRDRKEENWPLFCLGESLERSEDGGLILYVCLRSLCY